MKAFKKYNPIQVRWNEPLGEKECPYAYRWVFNFHFFAIRVHHFLRSDDKRYMHDHGWSFITCVLKGSYTDVSLDGKDLMKAGSVRYRKATHAHYVDVPDGGCWTVVLSGRSKRKWGFWVDGKFKRPLKYFHKFGHPPCSEQ